LPHLWLNDSLALHGLENGKLAPVYRPPATHTTRKSQMAIKKSDLYSSLWASCDELRGGMDASQYKDYVLFMLFIKYISDKYGN
jgi:type I restriction enzyme M protein